MDSPVPFSIPIVSIVPLKLEPEMFWSSVPVAEKEERSTACVPPPSVISRLDPFKARPVLNSLVGSLSASSTPSCKAAKSTVAELPFSMSICKDVPAREAPVRFWSSDPVAEKEERSTDCVPPPSEISKLFPFKINPVLNSLEESLSASSTPS